MAYVLSWKFKNTGKYISFGKYIDVHVSIYICERIHIYIYIYIFDTVFLPCNMEPKLQSASLTATQALANNVSMREKRRLLKSPRIVAHYVSWDHKKEQPLPWQPASGSIPRALALAQSAFTRVSTHAAWPRRSELTPAVIINSPIPVSKKVPHLSINYIVMLNTVPLCFSAPRTAPSGCSNNYRPQSLGGFSHPGASSGPRNPLFLGPLTTKGPFHLRSRQRNSLASLLRLVALNPYIPFLQARSALGGTKASYHWER